jgi:hypothetical protein
MLKHIALIFLICLVGAQNTFAKVLVAVPSNVLVDYKKFLGTRLVSEIKSYGGDDSSREIVDLILFQQAFLKANHLETVELVSVENFKKASEDLKSGSVFTYGSSLWLPDIKEMGAIETEPLVEAGQFESGVFTTVTNLRANNAKSLSDLQKLKAVSSEKWIVDWQTLSSLGIPTTSVATWKEMVTALTSQHADIVLAPLMGDPNGDIRAGDVKLRPIKGIKVGLNSSRHFVVSKAYPNSGVLLAKLNEGIRKLKKEGVVRKAYLESGVINAKAENWTMIKN